MRIDSNGTDQEKKKSNIKLLDLLVLTIILVVSMLASAIAGVYYMNRDDVAYHVATVKSFFSSIFYQEIKNETYINSDNGIDTLILDIPFESMQSLLQKRADTINIGVLLTGDEDFVKGKATLNDDGPYDIELRLKGDWADHLAYSKWSYRIHVKDDQSILGMDKFSIMDPVRRNYLNEWAYHEHLMYEDILTTRYGFVNVVENGEKLGVFAIEESFTVELLESQEERQGVILSFDEDSLWINRANFIQIGGVPMYDAAQAQTIFMITNNEQAEVKVFQSNSVYNDPVLKAEADDATLLLQKYMAGELPAREVFDVDKFGMMLAITDLWGANHAAFWHNLRYYYNPITSLLEPIGYDGDSMEYKEYPLAYVLVDQPFFDDPDIRTAYFSALDKITKQNYLNEIYTLIQPGINKYLPILQNEYDASMVTNPWDNLMYRAKLLSRQIDPPFPASGIYSLGVGGKQDELTFHIKNLMITPITVTSFEFVMDDYQETINVTELSFEGDLVNDGDPSEITYVTIQRKLAPPEVTAKYLLSEEMMNFINAEDFAIYANVKISGINKNYRIPLLQIQETTLNNSRPIELFSEAELRIDQFPFIERIDEHTLYVQAGDWNVDGDLVIPEKYELIISPGATLKFDEGAILLTGNRLYSAGTESQPVTLTSSGDSWGGVVVLSSEEKSTLKYTSISNTSGVSRDGWVLTGGVTFYKSPVNLTAVTFLHHQGEDALNLIHSDFDLRFVSFSSTPSDALDSDFSDGLISHCAFTDIGGDAIDVSGSIVEVENTQMTNITDKAISAGEKSQVFAKDIFIDNANIGIASKDLSFVEADTITLNHISYAGFAAYIKKNAYGPASIEAINITSTDVETMALVQTGNEIKIDGEIMDEQDLDVDTLYSLGILGN